MNKKIISILSAITLLGGAMYLSGQGSFGALSSNVLSSGEVCSVASYVEQIQTVENNIALAQEKIQTIQQSIQKNNENIATLSQTLRERQAALKQAQANKKKCGTGRSINQSCIKQADTYIGNLQDAIKNMQQKITENKTNITEKKKNIKTQQNNIKTWKRDIASFARQKAECEEKINRANPETGGDLPPYVPETGGDLPPANPETNGGLPIYDTSLSQQTGGDLPPAELTPSNNIPANETPASAILPTTETNMVMGGPVISSAENFRTEMSSLFQDYISSLSHNLVTQIANFETRFNHLENERIRLLSTNTTIQDSLGAQLQQINNSLAIYKKQSDELYKNIKTAQKNADKLRNSTHGKTLKQIKTINQRIDEIEKNIAELRKKVKKVDDMYFSLNNQRSELLGKHITVTEKINELSDSVIYNKGRAPLYQDMSMAQSMKYVIESYKSGTDANTCPKATKYESIDVMLDSTVLASFNSGHNTLYRLTTAKPTPIIPNVVDIYITMKDILPEIEAGINLYETQSKALKDAEDAPHHCFQWWKELGTKKRMLSVENIKTNNLKLYVQNVKKYMLWMEENNYIKNT